MNKILAIAFNTYKEANRNKVFYIILFFAIGMLGLSALLANLALGEDDRIIKDIGLAAINIFGLLLSAFVGVNLVYEELDKRTLYTIIASGVTRTQFIIGKYLGLLLTVVVNVVLMGILLCALIVALPNSHLTPSVIFAIFLFIFEMMVITAFAVLFSSFSTPILSAFMTAICYVIGHMSEDLWSWSQRLQEQGSFMAAKFLQVLYYILPNLAIFNIRNQVVYQEDIGSLPVAVFIYPLAGILYTAILLMISITSFSNRDFK